METIKRLDDNTLEVDGVKFKREPKPEYIDGKWYIAKCNGIGSNYLIRYKKTDDSLIRCYDFTYEGADQFFHEGAFDKIERFATKDEIEKHLIGEAKKRGYREGITCHFKCGQNRILQGKLNYVPDWGFSSYALCLGSDVIWEPEDGWTEILPSKKTLPKTKQEFEIMKDDWIHYTNHNYMEFLDQYDFNN